MKFCGKSDNGLKRLENQDDFATVLLENGIVVCVVCDGMGGANGGSIASELARCSFVEFIKKSFRTETSNGQIMFKRENESFEDVLKGAVHEANAAVFKKASRSKKLSGMGTTLVGTVIINDMVYIANVGDSRLYFLENGVLTQKTHDHSYVQTLVDLGQITPEEAVHNPHRNIITKAIGTLKTEDPDIFTIDISSSRPSHILLCSDGLTNFVTERRIAEIMSSPQSPEEICRILIDEANKEGGGDNITAIVIELESKNGEN